MGMITRVGRYSTELKMVADDIRLSYSSFIACSHQADSGDASASDRVRDYGLSEASAMQITGLLA